MGREEYLKCRKSKQYNLEAFYQYYVKNSKNGPLIGPQDFHQIFSMYLQGNFSEITTKLDSEFKINILTNKKGEEIWFN